MNWNKHLAPLALIGSTLILGGCFHDDDDDMMMDDMASYEVTVTNLTASQPFSPLAVVLHGVGYNAWQVGTAASVGLEQLAEGGDTTTFISEADASSAVKATGTGSGLILPGASDSVIIEAMDSDSLKLSLATMLVNTNDGFTGIDAEMVGSLAVQSSKTLSVMAYDAGTEGNTETAGTIPGPAGGGEGYNSSRDDRDSVGGHPGVVTSDDGLSTSALTQEHRFDNPVARITITRLQ